MRPRQGIHTVIHDHKSVTMKVGSSVLLREQLTHIEET